jgi:rRNA small subunit pseudouridine methyltransferase Nep1
LEEVAAEISNKKNPAVLIGGFPKGHFTPETAATLDRIVRIHSDSLDAHVVAARLVYELERIVKVPA